MGLLDIPSYDKKDGIIAAVLAILLGGLGMIIWGLIQKQKDVWMLGIVLLLLTLVFGVGHLLAIVWGIIVLVKSL